MAMGTKSLLKEHSDLLSVTVRLVDVAAVVAGAAIAYLWRFGPKPVSVPYESAVIIGTLLSAIAFQYFGGYRAWRGRDLLDQLKGLVTGWLLVVTILIVLAFLTKTSAVYSRQWMVAWVVSVSTTLCLFRLAMYELSRLMRRKGWNHRRIVIVGAGALGRDVLRNIRESQWLGLDVLAFFDDKAALHGQEVDGVAVHNSESLGRYVPENRVQEVWLALPLRADQRVKQLLEQLRHSTVTVRFVPDIFGFRLLNHAVTEIAGIPVIDLSASPMVGVNRIVKEIEDKVVAFVILVMISPLLLLIAGAVKLSSEGPVLFKQKRHGWDGRAITVYKFRTMKVHEEAGGKVTQATKGDSRVTPLGRLLRRTSLDELPQFFNVLQGRMSIVGPRPHAIKHNEEYMDKIDAYMQRHKVKPGITGWAQVNGLRGETDTLEKMKQRVEYDLFYIENWSLWFDIKIIILTVFKGFIHDQAY